MATVTMAVAVIINDCVNCLLTTLNTARVPDKNSLKI